MIPYQSQKFKSLQRSWYEKLSQSGFNDIENSKYEVSQLKDWHCVYFQIRHTPESFEAKQEYYRLATAFFNTHDFQSEQDKQIWLLHADGYSIREIAAMIQKSVYRVHKAIKSLSTIMLEFR